MEHTEATVHLGSEGAGADGQVPTTGWAGLSDLLAGFAPDQVPALVAARALELAYPLLHALTRGSLRDFFARVAALESMIADSRPRFSTAELDEVLYWLTEPARESLIRLLRAHGWLGYDSDGGYHVTEHGHFVANVLSFLRTSVRDLRPTVEGIDYMLRMGVDPVQQVLALRSQLEDLRLEMDAARSSHSEVLLRAAADRLGHALDLSERIRAVLRRVPLDMTAARRVAQDVHDLLSRLHGVGSDLHAAITEVGRQYLHLVGGLTTADIISTLMRLPLDELAAAGRAALQPVVTAPPLLVPELLAAEAEAYLSRERQEPQPISWDAAPEAEAANAAVGTPPEVDRLLDDVDRVVQSGRPRALEALVPRGDAGESFLRATLLPLLGERVGGQGVAGRLGALPLALRVDLDGYPQPAPAPLTGLSPGEVRPKEGTRLG